VLVRYWMSSFTLLHFYSIAVRYGLSSCATRRSTLHSFTVHNKYLEADRRAPLSSNNDVITSQRLKCLNVVDHGLVFVVGDVDVVRSIEPEPGTGVVEFVQGDVPELSHELLPASFDYGVRLGDDLLCRLDVVDVGDGLDGVDGRVRGHVRVVDDTGRKRRFFLQDDFRLSKRFAEGRDRLACLDELATLLTELGHVGDVVRRRLARS
jgi:hypothetical protein